MSTFSKTRPGIIPASGFKFIASFTFVFLMVSALHLKGQDPEFSQFYANPIYLNPAFTGTSAFPRVVMNYRNQWPKQGNTFVTYNMTYDQYVNKLGGGIGFKVMYDKELNGIINTMSPALIYSEHLKVSDRFFFTMALEGGMIYKKYNTSELIFPGMIEQGSGTIIGTYPLPFENAQKIIPDVSFGAAGQLDDVYFGFALHHLTQPDQSIIRGDQLGRLPLKVTLHVGAKGHKFHRSLFSREFMLSPNIVYQQQGSYKQVNAGLYMKEEWLTFGLWYRNNLSVRPDALIAMVGFQKEKFHFGYSFDFSLSNAAAYSYGSHEISLTFFFGEFHRRLFQHTMVIPQM